MAAAGRPLILRERPPWFVPAAFAIAAIGCGGRDEPPALPEELPPPPVAAEPGAPATPDPIYGPDGELLESDRRVAGLTLPRGLQEVLREERRYVYRSEAPITKVQRYFGVRLITGQVDAMPGGGAIYRDAVPRSVRGAAVRLDVTIEPSSISASRVEIVERPPPMVAPPSEEETLERLRERLRQAD